MGHTMKAINDAIGDDEMRGNTEFIVKEYDVTSDCSNCCIMCTVFLIPCPGMLKSQKLTLGKEEVILDTTGWFYNVKAKKNLPYGELGNVEATDCCCFTTLASPNLTPPESGGAISPGWGCSHDLVEEIVDELRARMKHRGDTGQIRRQERMQNDIDEIKQKLDEVLRIVKGRGAPEMVTMER